jgi:CheY-like chemotaxis protein
MTEETPAVFLVVDDDELSRDLLTVLLEAEGYSVSAVASGQEALALFTRPHDPQLQPAPNVILADLQMPGLSGEKLATALRSAAPAGTRLLAMSGSRPSTSLEAFDGFVLKPFTMEELRTAISSPGVGPEDAAEKATSALDEGIYKKLAEVMPADQLYQMFALFISDARTRVERMQLLAREGDDAGYRGAAHAIKGGAGMLGASQIYKWAEAAETDGLGKSPNGTVSYTKVLKSFEEFTDVLDRLQRILLERVR